MLLSICKFCRKFTLDNGFPMEHSSDEEEEEEDLDEVIAENLMENPGNSFLCNRKTAITSAV